MKKFIFIFLLFISVTYISKSNNNSSIESFDPSLYSIVVTPTAINLNLCDSYRFNLSGPTLPAGAIIRWSVSEHLKVRGNLITNTLLTKAVEPGTSTVRAYISYSGMEYSIAPKNFMVINPFRSDRFHSTYSSSRSETFPEGTVFGGTITINNGNTVTINNTIKCTPRTKIIINPGGKLIIDGGKLTSYCNDELWKGIVVMGTKSNTTQNESTQGVIEIINNGTIEHALVGIKTGEYSYQAGGIIKAENATFSNNFCNIEFRPYKRMSGGIEADNLSYFTKCNFILNWMNRFVYNGLVFENGMVKLDGVSGIYFKGCIFKNDITQDRIPKKRGIGIHSTNSGFYVDFYCQVPIYTDGYCVTGCAIPPTSSEFSGLEYGIYATGSSKTFTVKSSTFSDNYYAIYAGSIHNFNIFTSNFYLNDLPYVSELDKSAIKVEGCRDFKIEGNYFIDDSGESTGFFTGIHIKNCGLYDSKIYRNTFTGLRYGIYTEGNNGGSSKGVRIECNKFRNGNRIMGQNIFISSSSTIAKTQGSPSKCANNEFSSNGGINNNSNPNNIITYYYCSNEGGIRRSYVNYIPGGPNSCVQTICGSTLIRDTLIWTPGPGTYYANDNDPLSIHDKMYEIYTSNMEEFNLSDYQRILEEFKEGETNESMRSNYNDALALQEEINILDNTMGELSKENISYLLNSGKTDINKLQNWYKAANGLSEKYSLVESYRDHGNYADASSLLAEIPYMFELNEEEYENYLNYVDLSNFRDKIINSLRYFDELTEEEISELQNIANKVDGNASILAYGILCYFYNLCPEEGEIEEYFDEFFEKKSVSAEVGNISIFPNPASNEISINSESIITNITIIDYLGKKILELNNINNYNTSVNIKEIPVGIYFVKVDTEKESTYIKFVKE